METPKEGPHPRGRLMKTTEVARWLRVSTTRVRALFTRGQLRCEKVGSRYYARSHDVMDYVPRRPGRPVTKGPVTTGAPSAAQEGDSD